MQKVLIFANGEPNDGEMVQRALHTGHDAHVIAADGGARVAHFFGLTVHTVIGDMDSLPPNELKRLQARGAQILRYPPEKDHTDLELCLQHAAQQGANWIRIIGGIGGRFDQVLANVLLMTLPDLVGCDVELVAGKQAIRLLPTGVHHIQGDPNDTISLIPIAGHVRGIRTQGLRYALIDETLHFGLARGVSNVMQAHVAQVQIQEGILLLVHTVGKAD
jgi:thiamine pyrophosphokinase